MKLHIRSQSHRCVLTVENSEAKLSDLISRVRQEFHISDEAPLQLSLNGSDPLDSQADDTLTEAGIVCGDLLYALIPSEYITSTSTSTESRSQSRQEMNEAMDVVCGDTENDSASLARTPDSASSADGINRYLSEVVLLRDAGEGRCPQTLRRACTELQPTTPIEYLCVALHVLMTELGFQPQVFNNSPNAAGEGGARHYRWRLEGGSGGVRFEYGSRHCRGARCQLVCVPVKSLLVVHGSVQTGVESSYKTHVQLRVEDFVRASSAAG